MRALVLFLICLCSSALAIQEVTTSRVRVIFSDVSLEAYAQEVAAKAERALDVLEPLFGESKQAIVVQIDPTTDVFNAYALPIPRPRISLRPLFPGDGLVGLRADDLLYLLLIHELTHIKQLAFLEKPGGDEDGLRLGLVGEGVAPVPPAWFLEGIATYTESVLTTGGRLEDAYTRGLLDSLVLSEGWPSLTDASLITYAPWPGGQTRYLLGAGFVAYLVEEYGFESILDLLRQYNTGFFFLSFSQAWRQAVGTELSEEWEQWRVSVFEEAEQREAGLKEEILLTDTNWYTGTPSFSPDGRRLAWTSWPPAVSVAEFKEGELQKPVVLKKDILPQSLGWLDQETLVYNRIIRQYGTSYFDLFSLNIFTKEERRLSQGARAQFPAINAEGCVVYVRDFAGQSGLYKQCFANENLSKTQADRLWDAPKGSHIVGLDISPAGQVLLSIWRAGQVDLALLVKGELEFLTQDDFQDLDARWLTEDTVQFRSDRNGIFNLYRLYKDTDKLTRLTSSLGGAFEATSFADTHIYVSLGESGFNLALLEAQELDVELEDSVGQTLEEPPSDKHYEVKLYSPITSLQPYGWLPLYLVPRLDPLGLGLAAAVYGQDDSGEHSYRLTLGYDSKLTGYLAGAHIDLAYGYRSQVDAAAVTRFPLGFGVQFGIWPHAPHLERQRETALGFRGNMQVNAPIDAWSVRARFELGLVQLRSFPNWQPEALVLARISEQRSDSWGYPTRGARFSVTGVRTAGQQGTASVGVWSDLSYYYPLSRLGLKGTADVGLRMGYRQAPAIPIVLDDWAAVGRLGYRYSFRTNWRLEDGIFAVERLSVEPRLHLWYDGPIGLAGDLSLRADSVLVYDAPISLGLTLGYAKGFWYSLGIQVPVLPF